jgi:hypothetical protein
MFAGGGAAMTKNGGNIENYEIERFLNKTYSINLG